MQPADQAAITREAVHIDMNINCRMCKGLSRYATGLFRGRCPLLHFSFNCCTVLIFFLGFIYWKIDTPPSVLLVEVISGKKKYELNSVKMGKM
jgi:hypothetical protein